MQWLAVREGLVDTQLWRVRLRDYHPAGRFGASFHVKTGERFSIGNSGPSEAGTRSTPIDEI